MISLKNRPLGIAVVGAGYWGGKLVREYLALSKEDKLQLKYVVDSDTKRLKALGEQLGLPSSILQSDSSAVLKDSEIDAVHLATPNETHFPLGMAALDAGKNLLVEKPMATTMRDALKLARRAEEKSLVLHVGHVFRFNNAMKLTRTLVRSGEIGKLLCLSLDWSALLLPLPNRDIILDLAPHPVDVLNYLLGEWPLRVFALGKSFMRHKRGQEEVATVVAEFDDDVFAQISLSWLSAGIHSRRVTITAEKATMDVDALNQRVIVKREGNSRDYPIEANNTIRSMISHFCDCIVRGDAPENSGLIGAITVGVLSAMRSSMDSGEFVTAITK